MSVTRENIERWHMAAGGLLLAAVVVGVAIVVGGPAARILNGLGALLWIASGAMLAWSVPEPERRVAGWLAALAAGLVLGVLVRPGGLLPAIVGFSLAGLLVAIVAGDRGGGWALLVPAIYLPVHLVYGIGKAVLQGSSMRVEPPPTAAIVPLAMIVAAAAGGTIAAALVRRYGRAGAANAVS